MFGLGLNRYVVYAVIVAGATAILSTLFFSWKHAIQNEALAEFNKKQFEQIIKDQKEFIANSQMLQEQQKAILNDLKQKNDQLDSKLKSLDDYLSSPQAKKDDKTSSEVLKRTIRELSGKK